MGCSLEFTPRPGAAILSLILPTDTPERRSPFGVGGEDFISIQAGDGGVLFFFLFFFFFFCVTCLELMLQRVVYIFTF